MALSKVKAPHPVPRFQKFVLKTKHSGTTGRYGIEQQVHWGRELGDHVPSPWAAPREVTLRILV